MGLFRSMDSRQSVARADPSIRGGPGNRVIHPVGGTSVRVLHRSFGGRGVHTSAAGSASGTRPGRPDPGRSPAGIDRARDGRHSGLADRRTESGPRSSRRGASASRAAVANESWENDDLMDSVARLPDRDPAAVGARLGSPADSIPTRQHRSDPRPSPIGPPIPWLAHRVRRRTRPTSALSKRRSHWMPLFAWV